MYWGKKLIKLNIKLKVKEIGEIQKNKKDFPFFVLKKYKYPLETCFLRGIYGKRWTK